MSAKHPLTTDEISAIVNGFDPIDWVQMELLAKLPPGKRMYPSLQASAMLRAGLRTAFKRRFPKLLLSEINMKVLEYLTFMDKEINLDEVAKEAARIGRETLEMGIKRLLEQTKKLKKEARRTNGENASRVSSPFLGEG